MEHISYMNGKSHYYSEPKILSILDIITVKLFVII